MWEQILSGIVIGGRIGVVLVGVSVIIALLIDLIRMFVNILERR